MNVIVAVDKNWAIGRKGGMLFHIPEDLKYFRRNTAGGTVIMGRKTLFSFPGNQPLPKRRNIIISRNPDFQAEGVEVACSPEAAMELVKNEDPNKVWCIGGGTIYETMLDMCKYAHITKVEAEGTDVDTYFPNLDKLPNWVVESTSEPVEDNGYTYRFVVYRNTNLD